MTIARETKSSISIASPDGGKNLRLKGALYERDFQFSESLRGELEAAGTTYRDARESRVSEAERCYQRGTELKREEYQQRYPRRDPTTPAAPENRLPAGNEIVVDWPIVHRLDLRQSYRRNVLVSEPTTGRDTDQRAEIGGAELENRQGDSDRGWQREEPRPVFHSATEKRERHPDLSVQETNGSELQRQITPENSPEPLSDDLTYSGNQSHDRDRKTLVERIRALTERLKDTAASFTRQLQEFTGHVRENTERESSLSQSLHKAEPASRGLEQASERLERHSQSLSQIVAAKEQSLSQENDRGMSL